MASYEVLMEDGESIYTVLVNDYDSTTVNYSNLFLQEGEGDTIIGFDTEWSYMHYEKETKVVLLKFCNRASCLVVKINDNYTLVNKNLGRFFCNKAFVFAGVHMQKDLEKLRKQVGFEVPNFVDLSQLASKVFNRPLLSACGVRELANEVLLDQEIKPGVFNALAESDLRGENFSRDLIKAATADAYAAYKIAKTLLK
ncbi:hypothetical protein LWI29_012923 [Acer saccharum]|uniref:3'-5' exonuclease domain-containing protein n=1 Tax=Acer saccharum TaxID=4024 RepID=A0AA39VVA9_ACESA|nr:hypothetical protein LWI29_012923 [Acer saccharum]KAK1583837.1 hypothetical protein Q3G72_027454 [Acer saccharum]